MKVIFVTDLDLWSMGKGKGGEAFFRTIKKYKEMGDEVFLVSDVEGNKKSDLIEFAHNILIVPSAFKKWIRLRKIGLLFRYLDHKITSKRFYQAIKQILDSSPVNGTVLYAYEIFGVEVCKQISIKYKIPLVTRFQGTTMVNHPYTKLNCILRYPHYQALKTESDLVIMTDDGTRGDKILNEIENKSRRLFMKNGLDLRNPSKLKELQRLDRNAFRNALGVAADEIMFLTVSRLDTWKRVERAIIGFNEFLKQGGEGKLVVVGDGGQRQAYQDLVNELGIENSVLFVGAVKHEHVYRYMIAADIFLSFYDLSNVGNPLLEAMTLGKCIVTYDVGDTRRVIRHNENGILLNSDTLKNMGNVLVDLAGNSQKRERLGRKAMEYAEKFFLTWDERMDKEYQEVLCVVANKKDFNI